MLLSEGVQPRVREKRLERLRYIREQAGYSQQDLADESSVSQHTISEIELGRRKPQGRTLRKLAKVLDVRVADLTGNNTIPKVSVNTIPKIGVLSSRDTEAIAPEEEVLYTESYVPDGLDVVMVEAQEVMREARKDYVHDDAHLVLTVTDDRVEVRAESRSLSEGRRTPRTDRRRIGERT
jgi:transcriptional regulator with XRE-family HTH domain